MSLRKLSVLAMAAASLLYPFAVYLALGRIAPYWIALALCALMLLRAWLTGSKFWLWPALGAGLLVVFSVAQGNSWQPVKLYPALANAALLLLFAGSVASPPTVIERLARLTEPTLTSAAVAYARKVTLVWCVFFVVNGGIALATALWASDASWALYNGFLAYVAMGVLFAAEWLV
ncbi:MAG: hypothetical protein JWP29_1406, partial [Rhodoferax sp.]|nr:hypothetical protein [Rhodoferax sp.]